MSDFSHFDPAVFSFNEVLLANNNREWFHANKAEYEASVREPARAFIRAVGERLEAADAFLTADDRKVGGSMMRVYRDTRFSKDKTPYKTNLGIQFRHAAGKDVHAPGLYMHLAPDECFVGIGMWRPDREPLLKIREAIAEQGEDWTATIGDEAFTSKFKQGGDSLKRAPRGFDKAHPMIDEIKRKDFIAMGEVDRDFFTTPGLVDRVMAYYEAGYEYCGFLCAAIGQPF
jgi:uncharacterized protein (TIGR02453 family)